VVGKLQACTRAALRSAAVSRQSSHVPAWSPYCSTLVIHQYMSYSSVYEGEGGERGRWGEGKVGRGEKNGMEKR